MKGFESLLEVDNDKGRANVVVLNFLGGRKGAMSLPLTRRQRNVLIACAAVGAGGYISYRIYTSPAVARKRRQLFLFFESLSSLLEVTAKGGDCAGLLWTDFHNFLLTDKDEVPQSLKQLLKVGQTREFQLSVAALCRSVTQGVVSSLARSGPSLSDGTEYGSALYEELSFRKDGLRKTGKTSGELGYRDSRHSWKDRRLRLSGETDGSQYKEAYEDDDGKFDGAVKKDRMERSDSASRFDVEDDEDDVGRYSAWMTSRNYYRAESAADGGKGKSRSQGDRRLKGEGKAEGLPERLVGKLFTEAGKGFASAVVASAARSIVLSVLQGMEEKKSQDRKPQVWSSSDWSPEAWKEDSVEKPVSKDGIIPDSPRKPVFSEPASGHSMQDNLIDFASSSKGKALIADCIETFIGTAVSVYLAKTRDVNFYEDMIASVVKPSHRVPVKELLTSVCNGAVETLIRTSHDVMSAGSSGSSQSEPECSVVEIDSPLSSGKPMFALDSAGFSSDSAHPRRGDDGNGRGEGQADNADPAASAPCTPENSETQSLAMSGLKGVNISFDQTPQVDKVLRVDSDKSQQVTLVPGRENNGKSAVKADKAAVGSKNWVDGISRTLAVPSNRALVLDVAGTMTHEAVRSAIEVVAEKVSHPFRSKKKEVPKDEKPSTSTVVKIVTKTGDLAIATASKAMVVMTMCLALCLHTLVGPARYAQSL